VKRGGESGRASRGEKERVGQSSKDGGAAVAAPVAAAAAAATATAAAAADKGRSERKRGREEAAEVRPSLEFIIAYKNP
jgi:ribosomal protein L12E/L44/L45/RPP1/RPP2